jgi:cytidyltransferase-like protein
MPKTIIAVSGYFNPLHRGHIEYFENSKKIGDILVVIVNNDDQVIMKKGKTFMSLEDRLVIIRSLACVDMAIASIDTDRTVCKTLECLRPHFFANGGDQFNDVIPESNVCDKLKIKMVDGMGGKIQSSSWILSKYQNDNVDI